MSYGTSKSLVCTFTDNFSHLRTNKTLWETHKEKSRQCHCLQICWNGHSFVWIYRRLLNSQSHFCFLMSFCSRFVWELTSHGTVGRMCWTWKVITKIFICCDRGHHRRMEIVGRIRRFVLPMNEISINLSRLSIKRWHSLSCLQLFECRMLSQFTCRPSTATLYSSLVIFMWVTAYVGVCHKWWKVVAMNSICRAMTSSG